LKLIIFLKCLNYFDKFILILYYALNQCHEEKKTLSSDLLGKSQKVTSFKKVTTFSFDLLGKSQKVISYRLLKLRIFLTTGYNKKQCIKSSVIYLLNFI
jgi:hypothetical protein